MKKYRLLIGFVFICFSLIVIKLNIKRYRSFEIQRILNSDIVLNNQLNSRGMQFINSIDDVYPSLNIFAMPLTAMKAQYLLAKDSLNLAINYLEDASLKNPYLMFSESRLAEIYLSIGDIQKSDFYTRKAFKNLPNNPVHFVLMVKLLKRENKEDSIYYYFNKVKNKIGSKDYQVYNIVLASLFQEKENIEKYNLKEIANEALIIHKNEMSVKKMADYIFFTQYNVDLAADKYQKVMTKIRNGETENIDLELKEILNLHPNVKVYNDNYIIANFNLKNYKKITEIYNKYLEYFIEIEDRILYYFALSFYNENDLPNACSIINVLNDRSFIYNKNDFLDCF